MASKPAKQAGNKVLPPAEKRWKKGQSGNPSGRPKGPAALMVAFRKKLADPKRADEFAEACLAHAIAGKGDYAREILNRVLGKVPDVLEAHVTTDRLRWNWELNGGDDSDPATDEGAGEDSSQ